MMCQGCFAEKERSGIHAARVRDTRSVLWLHIDLMFDQSVFVQNAISAVLREGAIAAALPGGAAFWISGNAALTQLTTSSVEASPFLIIVSSSERYPSACTMFCCTAQPSRTCATSER